jgi:hypothetical protein
MTNNTQTNIQKTNVSSQSSCYMRVVGGTKYQQHNSVFPVFTQ